MAAPTLGDMIQAIGSPAEWGAVGIGSSMASAYLAADLDLSATPAWYEIGSGAETITEAYDYGSNYSTTTGRYTCPVAGVYGVTLRIGVKVKDDSKTLINVYTALGVGGSAVRVGFSFFSDAVYQHRGVSYFEIACSASNLLSAFVYAAESGSSQPTILGGVDDNEFSVRLIRQL
jgi:hypothetical protein